MQLRQSLHDIQLMLTKATLPFQSHNWLQPELGLGPVPSHMHMRRLS